MLAGLLKSNAITEQKIKRNSFRTKTKAKALILLLGCLFLFQTSALAIETNDQVWEKKLVKIDLLDFKDVEIHDALKIIAQKSGINIIAGQSVRGKVTVYLKDILVEDALKTILESHGWAYVLEDNVIKVMTNQEYSQKHGHDFGRPLQTKVKTIAFAKAGDIVTLLNQIKSTSGKVISDASSNTIIMVDTAQKISEMEDVIETIDVPVKTEIFQLSYAGAKEISDSLTELLTPQIGRVKFDERSNKIIVTDVESKLVEIRGLIDAFDVKNKEVLIEAKILQIVLNDDFKMGVDWETIVSDYQNLTFTSNFDALSASDKRGQMSVGTLDSDDFTFVINALSEIGETNILSSPRIITLNNQEARILVGSEEPYVTSTTTTTASGPSTTAENVNFIEVGVKLYVTPTIHEDDFITVKIKPEISSKVDVITTSNNNIIPIVESSEAETTVTVKNKTGIVIGGLIKEESIQTQKSVPILGKIPILGYAFRSKSDTMRKTEIVIFLSPEIIDGEGQEVYSSWSDQDEIAW